MESSHLGSFGRKLPLLPVIALGLDFKGELRERDLAVLPHLKELKRLSFYGNLNGTKDLVPLVDMVGKLPIVQLDCAISTLEFKNRLPGKHPENPIDDSLYRPLFMHPKLKYLELRPFDDIFIRGDMLPAGRTNSVLETIFLDCTLITDKSFCSKLKAFPNLKTFAMVPYQVDPDVFTSISELGSLEQLRLSGERLSYTQLQAFVDKTGLIPLKDDVAYVHTFSKRKEDIEYNRVYHQAPPFKIP